MMFSFFSIAVLLLYFSLAVLHPCELIFQFFLQVFLLQASVLSVETFPIRLHMEFAVIHYRENCQAMLLHFVSGWKMQIRSKILDDGLSAQLQLQENGAINNKYMCSITDLRTRTVFVAQRKKTFREKIELKISK